MLILIVFLQFSQRKSRCEAPISLQEGLRQIPASREPVNRRLISKISPSQNRPFPAPKLRQVHEDPHSQQYSRPPFSSKDLQTHHDSLICTRRKNIAVTLAPSPAVFQSAPHQQQPQKSHAHARRLPENPKTPGLSDLSLLLQDPAAWRLLTPCSR